MAIQLSRRSWRSKGDETSYSEPELVGYYSVDSDRDYRPDSSQLSYYKDRNNVVSRFPIRDCDREQASVRIDLDRGRDSITRSSYSPAVGKLLFTWIKLNHEKIQAPTETGRWIEPNFVCSSGLLFKLLCTPYAAKEGWIVSAAKWKGTIYLACSRQGSHGGFRMPVNDFQKFRHWAQNFDNYMLSDYPDEKLNTNPSIVEDLHAEEARDVKKEKPDTQRPIVGSGEFRGVYKLRFGDYSVLFDATIKAAISEKPLTDPLPLKDLECVQLVEVRDFQNVKQEQSFRRFKLLKWWCYGFLTKTEKCVCGFRDDNGIVHRLATYTLDQMIQMAKSYWKPSNSVEFCEAFLGKLSEIVVDDCFETIYTFEKKPYEDGIHITRKLPSSRYSVIPPSFFDQD